jgi:UDP-N-acetylmuramoyl-L-alanyl-D-glutamate--2,6-diaminopimelate ligase
VTGTNGKTSTTWMIGAVLEGLGPPVALTSTVGSYLGTRRLDVPMTFDGLVDTLRAGIDAGGRYTVLELTSLVLGVGFAKAWPCEIGVFTNLSEDHLDMHGSFEAYLAAKAQLFVHLLPGGTAVLNADDPCSALLAEVLPPGVSVVTYGLDSERAEGGAPAPDLRARDIRCAISGTTFSFEAPQFGVASRRMTIPLVGEVFVHNALASIAVGLIAGVSIESAERALTSFTPPAGRFEVLSHEPGVVVDYAHTPDALTRTLTAARGVCSGRLWLVFGAGGTRQRDKRSRMGEAARLADHVIVTTDNPRDEDPAMIAAEVEAGLTGHPHVTRLLDRAEAIEHAILGAEADDIVLIAGKGHEEGQEVRGRILPFSDKQVALKALLARARST